MAHLISANEMRCANTLAQRINASDDDAARKATLYEISQTLSCHIEKHPAANTPKEVPDSDVLSDYEKKLEQMSTTELIKCALPKMRTRVMTEKMTVDAFATLVAEAYRNFRQMCVIDGADI